jgi:hypothetical protein
MNGKLVSLYEIDVAIGTVFMQYEVYDLLRQSFSGVSTIQLRAAALRKDRTCITHFKM